MRLTKYELNEMSMFPYKPKDEELSTELDIVHKLGQLEDIFWRHNIAGKKPTIHYYCLGKRISKKKYEWFKEAWK